MAGRKKQKGAGRLPALPAPSAFPALRLRQYLDDHSAILRADRIKTPLLTISGDQDPNVPGSQSREIFYALRRLGKEVEWVHYANGAHRPPNGVAESVDFENRILAWYEKYLKADASKKNTGTM